MSKTASDLKHADWPSDEMKKYRPWEAVERYERDDRIDAIRERALVIAREAADLLKQRYDATRVILFGSLAHGAWFTPRSDIDLNSEGIPIDDFFEAEGAVQGIDRGFKVDLAERQECSPELRKRIEEEGIESRAGGQERKLNESGTSCNRSKEQSYTRRRIGKNLFKRATTPI
jgi:predicted nucleotidyltransferase